MLTTSVEIDTKGSCLLCHHPPDSACTSFNEESSEAKLNSLSAFKLLLRYLKVDVAKLTHLDTFLSLNNANFSVSLCKDCSSVADDFLELFQAYENIRLQLDLCVRQLHEFMEKGEENENRALESMQRINAGSGHDQDKEHSRIAELLRKEMKEKAAIKVKCSIPRISLGDFNSKPVPGLGEINENSKEAQSSTSQKSKQHQLNVKRLRRMRKLKLQRSNEIKKRKREEAEDKKAIMVVDLCCDDKPQVSAIPDNEQTNANFRCIYCDKQFSPFAIYETHQYTQHARSYLVDKGVLPATTSKQRLDLVVEKILELSSAKAECLLCTKRGYGKYHMRLHILQQHIPEIVQVLEKFPSKMMKTPSLSEAPSS